MSKKVLTISVAAYNDEKYISNVIESLIVPEINDIEILINDDGGKDNTKEIVEKYIKRYPDSIKFIHKNNGGYGTVLMKNIEVASGKYFKQLDGDDLFNKEGLSNLIKLIKENSDVDVFYTPYVNCYVNSKNCNKIIDRFDKLKTGKYKINEIINKYFNMHSLCFKLEILKKANMKLPEKCLYTDTIYCVEPFKYIKNIYISHFPVYLYSIGINGQSMEENSMKKHWKDHEKVVNNLIEFYSEVDNKNNAKQYLKSYIATVAGYSIIRF